MEALPFDEEWIDDLPLVLQYLSQWAILHEKRSLMSTVFNAYHP